MLTILSKGLRSSHEYNVFVCSGQIHRHDAIHASLFHLDYHDQYLENLPYVSMSSYGETLERLTWYECCKVRKKTRLIQHLIHVRKKCLQEKTSKL